MKSLQARKTMTKQQMNPGITAKELSTKTMQTDEKI